MPDFKVAIVTGAGKGIGRAIALRLAGAGYHVAAYSRTAADLEKLQQDLGGAPADHLVQTGDVAVQEAVEKFVATVHERWGRIDLLVNNAGFAVSAPVQELSVSDWDGMMAANVRGTFLFTRTVLPLMVARRDGVIVNIASIAGKDGFTGGTGYAASKHAVMGFADSLWREVRSHNIRVTSICPGSVDTHFFGPEVGSPGRAHMMHPDDVAEAVLYAARQPDRLFVKEIELRITHPRK
jgi:3-oxoacyl-[acyl-carrier protein] reductase